MVCALIQNPLFERTLRLRQSVLAAAAAYMRRNKLKIGDVIAITRRPDTQLVSSTIKYPFSLLCHQCEAGTIHLFWELDPAMLQFSSSNFCVAKASGITDK